MPDEIRAMPPSLETDPDRDERLARLGRLWFAEARQQEALAEAETDRQQRRRGSAGDGGGDTAGWSFWGSDDDCGGSDGDGD